MKLNWLQEFFATNVCSQNASNYKMMSGSHVKDSRDLHLLNEHQASFWRFLRNLPLKIIVHFIVDQPSTVWSRRPILYYKFAVFTFLMSKSMTSSMRCQEQKKLLQSVSNTLKCIDQSPDLKNLGIYCLTSFLKNGCVMAHSKTRPARAGQTVQTSTRGGGNLDFSVDSARFLAFTR